MSEPDHSPEMPPLAVQAEPAEPPVPAHTHCANCGAPLHGRYCHDCGQPVQGLVRHFSSVLSDVVDSVFNIDERLFRTLLPLYLHPGRLTLEYFAGRRARYVTPFRLVFFLAIIAFFSIQLTVRTSFRAQNHVNIRVVAPLDLGIMPGGQGHSSGQGTTSMSWFPRNFHPRLAWLPGFANDWLDASIENVRTHLQLLKSGSDAQKRVEVRQIFLGMFSAAPTVLFVLLPIFALLLKILYLFRQRLYMEHLIVAMHSHAFLMLSLLVLVALGVLRAWLVPLAAWLDIPFSALNAAAWIWIVVHLFVMQKRVYRQGWFMTGVKFACTGVCYGILLVFALLATSLIALAG